MSGFRIGQGEDIHRLAEGRDLILGGVKIPFEKGLLGHSDADVVYHAVSDALLGALGLRDIGYYFPDTDPKWEGADSERILASVYEKVDAAGYCIGNLDVSISCERPKLSPHIEAMKENLSRILRCDPSRVAVKAMTNEGLDAVGQGLAIRCSAIALLEEQANG